MPDQIRRIEHFCLTVTDKPGERARVWAALQAVGVNLLGISILPHGACKSQLDIVPEDCGAFRKAPQSSGTMSNCDLHAPCGRIEMPSRLTPTACSAAHTRARSPGLSVTVRQKCSIRLIWSGMIVSLVGQASACQSERSSDSSSSLWPRPSVAHA